MQRFVSKARRQRPGLGKFIALRRRLDIHGVTGGFEPQFLFQREPIFIVGFRERIALFACAFE